MPQLTFHLPTKIVFGADTLNQIGHIAAGIGDKALLVTDPVIREAGILDPIISKLESSIHGVITFDEVSTNCKSTVVDEGALLARQAKCNLVIGVGGKTVLNVAKAISFLTTNTGFIRDYFDGEKPKRPGLPCLVVPTIPSTAAEATGDFVLLDEYETTQRIFELPEWPVYPHTAVVDPRVTLSLPHKYMVASGIQVLANAIECYISTKANPVSDALSVKAVEFIANNLKAAVTDQQNIKIRANLSMAGVLASMSINHSTLGSCHALALALSAKGQIYQALASVILIPHIMEFNLTSTPGRYVQIARALGEDISDVTVVEAAIKSVEAVRKLIHDLNLPSRLSDLEVSKGILDEVAHTARTYQFLNFVPRPVSHEDYSNVLNSAY